MIEVAGEKIFFVDFQCQWGYKECPALFLAGLSFMGFDGGLWVEPPSYKQFQGVVKESQSDFLAINGKEHHFNWAHINSFGCTGDIPPEDGDYIKILENMKKQSPMLIFAHPEEVPHPAPLWNSGKTLDLLNEGLLDAIEIVNATNFPKHKAVLKWYYDNWEKGNKIPIVGGCDVHYLQAETRPNAVYTPDFVPCTRDGATSDIDLLGGLRTIVFAEECTEDAILNAVLNHQTVIETFDELVGPPELCEKLEKNNYWAIAEKDLKDKRELALYTERNIIAGESAPQLNFKANIPSGKLIIDEKKYEFQNALPDFIIPKIGELEERWVPLRIESNDNNLATALHVFQPIGISFYGCRNVAGSAILDITLSNRTETTLKPQVEIFSAGNKLLTFSAESIEPNSEIHLTKEITPLKDYHFAQNITMNVTAGNFKRSVRHEITFYGCRHKTDTKEEFIVVDREELIDYGNWDGPEDSSYIADIKWDDEGLHFHFDVTDDIHYQPYVNGTVWQADCVQFGIDASLLRGGTQDPMYDYSVSFPESGGQLHCHGVPNINAPADVDKFLGTQPSNLCTAFKTGHGVEYNATIPWDRLAPLKPIKGSRFGLFIVCFDNDGPETETSLGCKSRSFWPNANGTHWKAGTSHWAVITLI